MSSVRLSKFLAASGVSSRRKCEQFIKDGRVKVNNHIILDPHLKVNSQIDKITFDNRVITVQPLLYVALYKPRGYLSDLTYEDERNIARSLIPIDGYLFPVGRLDYHSEGLMIFTNDGDLAYIVMHPRYGVEKEYLAKFKGQLTEDIQVRLQKGIVIDNYVHKVSAIKFVRPSQANSWYRITLVEGRNRMIRKLATRVGHPVLKLKRIRIGPVVLGSLRPGQYRLLTTKERDGLLRSTRTTDQNSVSGMH